MYGVFSSELLILQQCDDSISEDLVEKESYEYERHFEENVKPLIKILTADKRENWTLSIHKQGIEIDCCYLGWMSSDIYPYLKFQILFEELKKIKTMYDLFKYGKAYCAKLECINEVNRFLIDGLLSKIENMEQALKEIKSDVQDIKEEKQNADESFKD